MRDPRATIGIAGAAVVVVLVTLAIAAFGVLRVPAVPGLGQPPAVTLPGRIAFLGDRRADGCLKLVEGSAAARTVACPDRGESWSGSLSWTPEGRVAVQASGPLGPATVLVEPDTGEMRRQDVARPTPLREPPVPGIASSRSRRADGAELQVRGRPARGDGRDDAATTLSVRHPDGSVREVFRLEGPRDYGLVDAQWSPDGEWILVRDSERRLLVVSADGSVGPRLVADRAEDAAWFIAGYPGVRAN